MYYEPALLAYHSKTGYFNILLCLMPDNIIRKEATSGLMSEKN